MSAATSPSVIGAGSRHLTTSTPLTEQQTDPFLTVTQIESSDFASTEASTTTWPALDSRSAPSSSLIRYPVVGAPRSPKSTTSTGFRGQ